MQEDKRGKWALEELSRFDKISIRNIDVLGHHGVDKAERQVGQRLLIDIDLYQDLSEAIVSDAISKTINYEAVARIVEKVAGEREFFLLETLAGEIATQLLTQFKPIAVTVRVKKAKLPIATRVESVEVEITRRSR